MANNMYAAGLEGFASGQIVWGGPSSIKISLLSGYVFNTVHRYVSDVISAGGVIVATSSALASMSYTDGALDAADVVFSAVSGPVVSSYILYQSSAVTGGADVPQSAQRLIAYFDSATGLPVAPDGTNIDLNFDDGNFKILSL